MAAISRAKELAVISQIQEAFRDTPRPVESNIVYDNSGKDLECNGIKATLKDILWSDIPRDPSAHYSASVFFMTPEAIVYFLPGYMIVCIENDLEYESNSLAIETLLTPPSRKLRVFFWSAFADFLSLFTPIEPSDRSYKDSRSSFNRYVSLVTASQRRAICSYLKLLAEKYSADYPPDEEIWSAIEFWQDFDKR